LADIIQISSFLPETLAAGGARTAKRAVTSVDGMTFYPLDMTFLGRAARIIAGHNRVGEKRRVSAAWNVRA
jgi:hypothetical protein